jgi:hypothetical protein
VSVSKERVKLSELLERVEAERLLYQQRAEVAEKALEAIEALETAVPELDPVQIGTRAVDIAKATLARVYLLNRESSLRDG